MKSPTLALHGAEITRLEAQTTYKIFDANPENEAYPYVVLGEISARDWSDKFEAGQEVTSTIHTWSQYKGRQEIEEMNDAIEQALTIAPLDLGANFRAVCQDLDSYDLLTDIDGKTRHGILRFRYLIEEV